MKIIKNKIFPFGKYRNINIFGILFTKNDQVSVITLNHEEIQTVQIKEMLYILFYIWYIIEWFTHFIIYIFKWLFKIIITKFKKCKFNIHYAYENISFEKEAYKNQDNFEYLKKRKHYSWLKYLL